MKHNLFLPMASAVASMLLFCSLESGRLPDAGAAVPQDVPQPCDCFPLSAYWGPDATCGTGAQCSAVSPSLIIDNLTCTPHSPYPADCTIGGSVQIRNYPSNVNCTPLPIVCVSEFSSGNCPSGCQSSTRQVTPPVTEPPRITACCNSGGCTYEFTVSWIQGTTCTGTLMCQWHHQWDCHN